MGPPAVSLVLVVVLGMTATLAGSTMVYAEESSVPNENTTKRNITIEGQDNQCSPLQRRQDLLDTWLRSEVDTRLNERESRLNELDTRLSTQLNGLQTQSNERDTRFNDLGARLNEHGTRLNRIDSRLDGIESDMKQYLQERMEAMDKRVERALMDTKCQQEVSTAPLPDTTPQQEVRTAPLPDNTPQQEVSTAPLPDNTPQQEVSTAPLPDNTPQQEVSTAPLPDNKPHHENPEMSMPLPDIQGDASVRDKPQVYRECQEALAHGLTTSGVYTIAPDVNNSIDVYCEQEKRFDGGGWTVFQVRYNGSVDFYNGWNTYRTGFGDLRGEFWLGNENIRQLTKHHDQQLKIELTSPEGEVQYANYSQFWVADESDQYRLTVTGYSGGTVPGDSMALHNGRTFVTKDSTLSYTGCAKGYMGAWWYQNCLHANLNGLYGGTDSRGLVWMTWKGWTTSMKATRMMLRKRP